MITLNITDSANTLVTNINYNLQILGVSARVTIDISATELISMLNVVFNSSIDKKELLITDNATEFISKLNYNFEHYSTNESQNTNIFDYERTRVRTEIGKTVNSNNLSFFLCTDSHYGEKNSPLIKYTIDNIKAVDNNDIDCVIHLGDVIGGGYDSLNDAENDANICTNALKTVNKPVYVIVGNHDNNKNGFNSLSADTSEFNKNDLARLYIDSLINENDNIVYHPDTHILFYKDFDEYNIRLISIYGNNRTHLFSESSSSYIFEEGTRTFLKNAIEDMIDNKPGYKAIVFSHTPIANKMANAGAPSESVALMNILTDNAAYIIAVFYGHIHKDVVFGSPILSIATDCNACRTSTGYQQPIDAYRGSRQVDTVSHDLWDIVNIDTTNNIIKLIRFGAGASRIIHYNNENLQCAPGESIDLSSTKLHTEQGTWALRTDDVGKATINNTGLLTIGNAQEVGTLITATYYDPNWTYGEQNAGKWIEYWIIKVVQPIITDEVENES